MFVQTLRVIGLTGSAFIPRANVNSVETITSPEHPN